MAKEAAAFELRYPACPEARLRRIRANLGDGETLFLPEFEEVGSSFLVNGPCPRKIASLLSPPHSTPGRAGSLELDEEKRSSANLLSAILVRQPSTSFHAAGAPPFRSTRFISFAPVCFPSALYARPRAANT